MSTSTEQPTPSTAQPMSFWESTKAFFRGAKEKLIGFIPEIPKSLLVSAAFMGGILLFKNHLPDFMGAEEIAKPEGFIKRLGYGLLVSAGIASIFGGIGEVTKDANPATPATPAKGNEKQVESPARQLQPEVSLGTPMAPQAGLPRRSAQNAIG